MSTKQSTKSKVNVYLKTTELVNQQNILVFKLIIIQNQLPTNNNLKRWGRSPTNLCPLCNNIQSNKHVLSNCSTPSVLQRYTHRHNAVLLILVEWLRSSIVDPAIKILADLDNSPSGEPTTVFNSFRPDIVIIGKKKIITSLELTICHESNFASSRDRKVSKYSNLASDLKSEYSSFTLNQYFIEVSVLGFISDLSDFQKSLKIKSLPIAIKTDLSNTAIKLSQNIYWNRNIATAWFNVVELDSSACIPCVVFYSIYRRLHARQL